MFFLADLQGFFTLTFKTDHWGIFNVVFQYSEIDSLKSWNTICLSIKQGCGILIHLLEHITFLFTQQEKRDFLFRQRENENYSQPFIISTSCHL